MKKKTLKAFTLVELVVVMAIFSMIMFGALMLVRPIQSLFKDTSKYVDSNAALDNMSNYLEGILVNSNRVHMYIGWDEFADIDNDLNNLAATADWKIAGDSTWGAPVGTGAPVATNTNPVDFFTNYFYLKNNMKLEATNTVAPGVPAGHTRTIEINRGALDTTLDNSKLQIYVLSILHNADGTIMKPGDGSPNPSDTNYNPHYSQTVGGIRLSTYSANNTSTPIKTENAINGVYYDKYDYRMIFGEVDRKDGVPIPAPAGSDEIFQYKSSPASFFGGATSGSNPPVMNISFLAEPVAKDSTSPTTFSSSSLLYTSTFDLKNSKGKEDVYFDVSSSQLNPASVNDPFTGNPFPTGYDSSSKYPIRYDSTDDPSTYIKFKLMDRYDGDFLNTVGKVNFGTKPISVDKWKISYKVGYDNTSFDAAANQNIHIVFTLPKEFIK
jgi:prepilin-type N-terminal cleavage/methylation domain-containing protein